MAACKAMLSLRARTNLLKLTSSSFTASTNQTRPFSKSVLLHNALKDNFIQASESKTGRTVVCRTSETDPSRHNSAHQGLYYSIPETDFNQWLVKSFPKQYTVLTKAFGERTLMVREPALEVLECLKATNYKLPVNRYVFYGREGCGKTISMAHVIHYCATQHWFLIHLPWAAHLNRYYREGQASSTDPGFHDQPLDAIEWLTYFKKMNATLLKDSDLKMTRQYVWNKRESSEIGSSLMDTIEFGIARSKYACDVVGAVLNELKSQASREGFRVLVAVDGVNAFWEVSKLRREEDKSYVEAVNLSLVKHFMNLLRNDWAGGAVVCSVDCSAGQDYKNKAVYTPRALLKKAGFEFMDPFIPIHVPEYSMKEAYSCLDYFIDRRWIQNPRGLTEEGKDEILHLSCNNPHEIMLVTKTW